MHKRLVAHMYNSVSFLNTLVSFRDMFACNDTDFQVSRSHNAHAAINKFGRCDTVDCDTIFLGPFDKSCVFLAWVKRWRHVVAHRRGTVRVENGVTFGLQAHSKRRSSNATTAFQGQTCIWILVLQYWSSWSHKSYKRHAVAESESVALID